MSHCSDSYIYNKRQLKVIFGSSTISANSESIDVKSEPVFYLNKATDNRYQDSKESCRDRTSQYPKDDYRSSRDQSSRNGYHSVLLPSPSSLLGGGGGGGGGGVIFYNFTRLGGLANFTLPEDGKVDFGGNICLGDIPFKGSIAIIKS